MQTSLADTSPLLVGLKHSLDWKDTVVLSG